MIRTTNVRNGFVDTKNVKYVTEDSYHRWTRRLVPRRGDVILTREAPLGDVGMIRTDESVFLGQRLYHFRADPERLDPRYLLYALMGPDLQEQIHAFGSGATVEHMRLQDVLKLEISFPEISLQRRLGGILAAYDDLVENNLRRIRILEEMARTIYREWFVHFQFPGHEGVAMKGSAGEPVPSGWQLVPLGQVAEEVRRNVAKGAVPDETPYVGLEHIPRRALTLDEWESVRELGSNKLGFRKGEVLFGKIRPYFHKVSVAPFDGVCSADTIVIRPLAPELYGLVVSFVSSDEFVARASATANGAKMPRANWEVLASTRVLVPEIGIAQRYSAMLEPMLELQQTLMFQIKNLQTTRDLLLPRLMSGQLSLAEAEAAV